MFLGERTLRKPMQTQRACILTATRAQDETRDHGVVKGQCYLLRRYTIQTIIHIKRTLCVEVCFTSTLELTGEMEIVENVDPPPSSILP